MLVCFWRNASNCDFSMIFTPVSIAAILIMTSVLWISWKCVLYAMMRPARIHRKMNTLHFYYISIGCKCSITKGIKWEILKSDALHNCSLLLLRYNLLFQLRYHMAQHFQFGYGGFLLHIECTVILKWFISNNNNLTRS